MQHSGKLTERERSLAAFMCAGWTRYDWADWFCAEPCTVNMVLDKIRKKGWGWTICDGVKKGNRPGKARRQAVEIYKSLMGELGAREIHSLIAERLKTSAAVVRHYTEELRRAHGLVKPRAPEWPEEQQGRLRSLFYDGHSMVQIAEIMGLGKGAVAGKIHRLNIKRDPRIRARNMSRAQIAAWEREDRKRIKREFQLKTSITERAAQEARRRELLKAASRKAEPENSRCDGAVYQAKFA